MISFDTGALRFQLRAAAVITRGDAILLHRAEGDDFWALPGGRVEPGESGADTLVREMREELGAAVRPGPMVMVVENFFGYGGRRYHEVGLYFNAEAEAGGLLLASPGPYLGREGERELVFAWFARDALHEIDLRPSFLVEALAAPTLGFRHMVQHDEMQGPA